MSLANFIKYLSKTSPKLAEDANKVARYNTLRSLERSLPLENGPFKEELNKMIPKGHYGITESIHPKADPRDINDLNKAFTIKLDDNQRAKEWAQIGQPTIQEMDQFSEDLATPLGDNLGMTADETENTLRKLQKIYGYVMHRHPDYSDAMIENKIPGFTKWMEKKKLGQ